MGINLNKKPLDNRPMLCPSFMENFTEAGSIYLVIHQPKPNAKDKETKKSKYIEKTAHFGVAVDITGSSTNTLFVATHFDLCVKSSTDHTTYIEPQLKYHKWNHYHLVRKIGQIPLNEITNFHMPYQYAFDLLNRLSQQVYSPLFAANNGPHWSSILNCQTMTRQSIQFLGYQFPEDIQLITDIVPTMFDIYVNSSLMTAETREKLRETLSY